MLSRNTSTYNTQIIDENQIDKILIKNILKNRKKMQFFSKLKYQMQDFSRSTEFRCSSYNQSWLQGNNEHLDSLSQNQQCDKQELTQDEQVHRFNNNSFRILITWANNKYKWYLKIIDHLAHIIDSYESKI